MSRDIYVFGHKNPDTDSICSSIAYANLKKQLGHDNIIAARIGSMNKETEFALKYFNVDKPKFIKSVNPQVSDLNLKEVVYVHEEDTLHKTLQIIINEVGRSVPVVDDNDHLIGIISISDIAPAYLGTAGKSILCETNTPFKNIINVLKTSVLSGSYNYEKIQGNIFTISELKEEVIITDKDILLCINEREAIKEAFKSQAGCIIFSAFDIEVEELEVPAYYTGAVICVKNSIYEVIKLMDQTIPIKSMVKKEGLEYFVTYETIEDVKENMVTSKHRRFPVVDEKGFIKGTISKSNLLDMRRKKVILVDHNETNQSIEGIEDAEIIEVIDHHRVANIQTLAPLYFRIEPLGCTSTIIGKMYEEHNIEIDKKIAGLMLSAILSDTLLFKSPTCTMVDIDMAKKLAKIAEVNIEQYGMELINSGSSLKEETPEQIISKDSKKFTFGKYKVMISQINTGDFEGFYDIHQDILDKMIDISKSDNLDLVVLMVTDVVLGGTELLVIGEEKWIAENAFDMSKEDNTIFLPGVLSRKKQVVPELMNAAKL